jgi:SAM-dependent methyltransferase
MARTLAPAASLLFRHVVQGRLETLFPRGSRVLHLGWGAGEDPLAPALAARGIRVLGMDPSPATIHRAREAADAAFDGAYASAAAVGLTDLRAVGAALAAVVRPGAPIVISLPGPWPLPAAIQRTLTGMGEARRRRGSRFGEAPSAASHPTAGEARVALGPLFEWTDSYALGVLLPGPGHERWVADHPQAFGLLAALERGVRHWPGLRQLGDLTVLEGRRKGQA